MTTDNVLEFKDKPARAQEVPAMVMEDSVPYTTVARPHLARLENDCRMLSILLELGVDSWDEYPRALEIYRSEQAEGGGHA